MGRRTDPLPETNGLIPVEDLYLGRLEERKDMFLRTAGQPACRVGEVRHHGQMIRSICLQEKKLERGCFLLRGFTGPLFRRLVFGQFLIEVTFTRTAGNDVPVHAEIFGDEIPVNPVFQDQGPFAEGLQRYQQDQ